MNRFQFVADHLRHLPGEAVVPGHRYRPLVVLRMDQRRRETSRPGPQPTLNSPTRSAPSTTVDNTYGRPRITAEINHGQPADQRINHKRIARINARQQHRGPATAPKTPHHHRRTSRHSVAGPAQP